MLTKIMAKLGWVSKETYLRNILQAEERYSVAFDFLEKMNKRLSRELDVEHNKGVKYRQLAAQTAGQYLDLEQRAKALRQAIQVYYDTHSPNTSDYLLDCALGEFDNE